MKIGSISKFIQYFGIFFILSFSAASIFIALNERELTDEQKRLFQYTTFFEDRFYDLRMRKTLDRTNVEKRIVLAEIDDKSINELGTWPIPRDAYVQMLQKLAAFGAKVVGFDVFFSENAPSCEETSPDMRFAQAIADFQAIPGNRVILPYSLNDVTGNNFEEAPEALYNFMMNTKQEQGANLLRSVVGKSVYPIETLLLAEPMLGYIIADSDSDGIFRHYRLAANVDELYFPSFALLTYQSYTGDQPELVIPNLGDPTLKINSGKLLLNLKGETKVRWLGGMSNFPAVPLREILAAPDDSQRMKEVFEGNIVFVGSTAFGAHDLRHTPVNPQLPGIYFHMNMVQMLLDGNFYAPHAKSTQYSWIILLLGTLLIIIIQLFGNAILDLVSVIAITVGLYLFDTYYLLPKGYEIKLFFCLFSIAACYSWNTFLHFYLSNKDKAFLKNAFGNYISPELIDEMYESGQPPELGGDSGIRTAYFTDIQSFSTFSEKLTATQLVELLNEYLTAMTDILLEEKGTLDKYEGDAIIAFFGAPMPLEDHARRACIVAARMQSTLLELRKKWINEGDKWPEIVHEMRMRIGINTGEIVTGNMGSASRMNYTMMGDSVNLAARLEEAAKQYGIFTQVSEATMKEAGGQDNFVFRELDTIRVVGKSEPVTTYELMGIRGNTEELLVQLSESFSQGIQFYKGQKWDEAITTFSKTLEMEHQRFPEFVGKKTNPSKIYLERCEQFKQTPPPEDWDGVFTLTSK